MKVMKMEKFEMKLFREASRCYLVCLFAFALLMTLIGCSDMEETIENPVTVGSLKYIEETVPAAPQAPGIGKPFVKEIDYYKDWKLTKPLSGTVKPGTTFWIKVVFSEPMQLKVADDNTARPILYYRTGKTLTRFRIAKRSAGGEDFVSGDAKPWRDGTDDYICKYTVPKEATGKFVVSVGKFNADKDGNTLSAFYTHKEQLTFGAVPATPVEHTDPVDPIMYQYINDIPVADILPSSAWVLDFPGPYKEYLPPKGGPKDFIGQVCMPVSNSDWAKLGNVAPITNAIVTITEGPRIGESVVTNEGGYYLFKDMDEDELYLRVVREYLEPKEVIVHRHSHTTPQKLESNRVLDPLYHIDETQPQNIPGTVLMGVRWPDAVRFITEEVLLPHEVLCTMTPRLPHQERLAIGGYYENHVVTVVNRHEDKGKIFHGVLAHELAHARQHAVAIAHGNSTDGDWGDSWEKTPEGKAYKEAREKDLREVSPKNWIGTLDKNEYYESDLLENTAQFCSLYWGVDTWHSWNYEETRGGGIRVRAPNRFKWAEEWLKRK